MHWMLCFVFVCKTLRVCWVCICALPRCSLFNNLHVKKQWCSSLCQLMWLDQVMNVQENASSDSTGDIGVGQDKAILWTGISQLLLDKGAIWLIFFPVDKIRPEFLLGTENHWPVYLCDATLSIHLKIHRIWCCGGDCWCHRQGTQGIPLPGQAPTSQRSWNVFDIQGSHKLAVLSTQQFLFRNGQQ